MIANRCRYLFVIMPLLITCSLSLKGQGICSSSALAPVFSQTFGQGANSTSKTTVPPGFTTNYDFQNNDPLSDGEYIVTPRVQNSQRNDWAVGGDHTGNANGNMFLVNAGTGAALFFSQQVDNLCPGSTYNFSAWLANVNTTSHTAPICGGGLVYPNVTFRIKNTSGTILATYSTGNLPLTANRVVAPNWQQYGFSFTLPSGTTSLVLEMVDAYGGLPQCGNDLAIDDILFTACTPTATVSFNTASTVCTGTNSNISVSLTNSPFTTPAYQWQKSTNGGTTWSNIGTAGTSATSYPLNAITLSDAAQYRVLVGPDIASLSSNTCITASNVITLTVNPSPAVLTGSNSPVCSGNSINLTATASGGTTPYSYTWSGPNSFSSTAANPSIPNSAVVNGGTYSIVVTDANSCTASGTVAVTVNATPSVAATTGSTTGCAGSTISLSNATAGGVWSSTNTAVATVNPSTGLVSVISAGTATITYTVSSSGCAASAATNITTHSVSFPPSLIECNSSTVNTQSNAEYMPVYSNNDPSSTYLWTITPAASFQGGSSNTDRYPKIQYANPVAYNVLLQFTSAGTTCSASQTVYRNGAEASGTIDGPATENVCNTTNTINLSATVANYTNQFAWSSNGTGSFSDPNSLNTTYTFSAADKTSGQVVITFTGTTSLNINGNCIDNADIDSKTITIEPPNTGTNTSGTICSDQLFTHTASSSVMSSTFTWVSAVLSGTGSGNATSGNGNISNTLTNLSTTTDFVVRYTITPSSNGCPGTPYTVTVTVKPLPSLTITNNATAICTGAATNVVLSDVLSGTQYSWSSSVISGTASGNSNSLSPTATSAISDVLLNTTNLAAVVRYSITAHSSAGCASVNTTDVTVYPQPTTADAGGDQSLCNATSATMAGNTPTSGTGTWTFISGPNTPTFTNAASQNTTVTGLTFGTYVFRWTISNGICASSSDDVTVVVSPVTNSGSLMSDITVCAPVNSGTLTVTGYTGNIISWETSTDNGATWNTSAVTTPTFPYNNLAATTLFKASVQSGSCSVLFTNTITVSVLQPPTTANAGPDQQENGINSATLAGNDPVHGSGVWTQISFPPGFPATIDDPASYNSTVSGLAVGAYVFRWTITNGSCGSSFDDVQIIADPPTVPGTISSDITVCATANSGTLTLTGYVGNILRWQYWQNAMDGWIDITNTTSNHSYSSLTTTTMFRAEVQNGTDAPEFSTPATVTVLPPVTIADAGPSQILCDLSSATLSANDPVSGIGTWSFIAGPGGSSFNNPNAYNSSVNGLTVGTYQFRWTISNAACASSFSDVTVEIVAPTNPGIVAADATVCSVSNGGTLSITGYVGTILQGEILSVTTGGNWVAFTNVGVNTITYPTLPFTTQFRALVQNSVCPAVFSNIVTITVLQPVTAANAGADQDLCAATTATMAANNPSSGTGTWSFVSGPNAPAFTDAGAYNTTVTGLIPGTYVFRWTIANGACASSQDDVTIVIHPSTVPGTISGVATVCSGTNGGTLSLTGNTGLIVRWEYSENGGANWTTIASNTSSYTYSNLTATTLYKASVQSGVCLEQYTNNVLVTVNSITVPGTLTGGTTVCTGINNGNLALSGSNGSVTRWEYSTDGGNNWADIAHTSTTYNFSNLTSTTSYRALVQNGVCANAYSNAVTVTVDALTISGSLSSPAVLCYGNNSGTLTLSSNNGNIVRWESSTDGGNNWSALSNTSNTHAYSNIITQTEYRAVIRNGVCASDYSNIISLTVDAATVAGTVSSDATVCISSNTGTLTLNGYTGSITGWELSTNGGGSWLPISNTGATQSFNNLSATTSYRAIVKNGVCLQDYSNPAVVTVDAATAAGTLSGTMTVCAGSNSGTLTLGGQTGSVLRWEYSQDGGANWNIIANTSASYSYNNINATTQYKAWIQSGVCASAYSNPVTITTDAPAITGVMQGSTTVCSGINTGTLTLTGNNGTILQWEYSTDGTNWNPISHTNNTYGFNNLSQQTQYRAVIKNGVCAATPSNPATVAISDITAGGVVSANATVCSGTNNGLLSLTGYTGVPVRWESSVDGGNNWSQLVNTTDQQSYNNLTASTLYRALVQSGVCPSQYSADAAITVDALTVSGLVSSDATVCITSNSGTLSLTGNTGNIVQWESSINNGGSWATLVNNSANQLYNNLTETTQYRALVKNGVCASQYSNPVTITVDAASIAGTASSNAIVCSTSNNGTLNLTGNSGNIVQWESSTDNGSSWNTIANTTATHSYNDLGATSLFRIMVKNGVCAPQYSNNVIITVTPPTIPGTVSADAIVCATGNNGTLNLTGNTGDILYWENSSNNGSSWNIISNNTTAQSYNNLSVTTLFRALVKNGVCPSQYAGMATVTVNPVTVAGTLSADATVCASSNNGTLNLAGHTGSILQWESSADNGSSWATLINNSTSQLYNNLTATTLYRALVKSGTCSPEYSNNITVTVNAPTVAGTVSADAIVCAASNNGTLTLTGNTGNILQWESSSDNGNSWNTLINNSASQLYNNLTATTQYRALVKNGACLPQYANAVTITVDQVTVPGTVSADATVCASANNGTLVLSQHTGNVLNWESSSDNGSSWSTLINNSTSQLYNNLTGSTKYRALVQNGICPSQYAYPATITVMQPVTPADAGPAHILCSTSSTVSMSGNIPSSGTGVWSLVNGNNGTTISDPQLNNTGITGLQTGSYTFRWTIANGVCPSSSSDVSIQVLPAITNDAGANSATVCAGQQVNIPGTVATGGNGAYQYQWESSADGASWVSINGATSTGYTFTPAASTLLRRIVTSYNCISQGTPVTVTVQQSLANNTISGDQDICDSTVTVPIRGTLVSGGDGSYRFQWEQNTTSSPSSGLNTNWIKIDNATSADLPAIRLRTNTAFRRIVTTALCNGPQALASNIVVVNVKPLPRLALQYKAGAYCSKDSSVEFIPATQHVDSIRWNFGDGASQTTGAQKINYRYSRPGVFLPTLQAVSAGNCVVDITAQDSVRIEEIKPGFRLTTVFECGKTLYRFTDTSQSYFTIAKRTWSINNVAVNDNADYQHLFNTMGDYNAQLKLESIYGCQDTLNASFKVSIFQFPKVNINAVSEACRNTLLELRSDISSVDSIIIRTWDLGNGVKASDSLVQVTYSSAGEYSVKLTAATINKCYDSAVRLLTIYPPPSLLLPAEQVMCKGDSLQLKADGAVSYIWKDQNDNIICSNCAAPTVRPVSNTQYRVIGYSNFGCSEVGATNVRVIAPLKLQAKLLDTLCAGESRRLSISGADNYQWLPAAGLSNLNTSNPVATPPVTTTYTVVGKDAFNCFADTAQIRLVVGNPTRVSVGKDTVILAGNSIQLRAVSPLPDIRKWRWEGADFSCLNCPAPVAKIVNDACISCTVTNQYGCTATDTLCIKTFCPTTEVFIPNAFTPDGDGVNDKLFVQGKGLKMIKSFRIFSRWGEMVFEKTNFSPGDPSMGWDGKIRGKLASPDVFVYVCEAICEKGTPATYKGNVAIIK